MYEYKDNTEYKVLLQTLKYMDFLSAFTFLGIKLLGRSDVFSQRLNNIVLCKLQQNRE